MTEHPCNLPPLFDIEGHGPIHVDGVKITATYGGLLAALPTTPINQARLQRAVEAASAPHKAVYLAPVAVARRPDLAAAGSPPVEVLPPWTWTVGLLSYVPLKGGCGSHLTVIFLTDVLGDIPDTIRGIIADMPAWNEIAKDFDL